MADVLSQSEIDALLSALSTGDLEPDQLQEEEKHKIKLYDFKSPQKFSKDHIRTLELIHDNFARITSNYLTSQIRVNVKVKIQTVEICEEAIKQDKSSIVFVDTSLFDFEIMLNKCILKECNSPIYYQDYQNNVIKYSVNGTDILKLISNQIKSQYGKIIKQKAFEFHNNNILKDIIKKDNTFPEGLFFIKLDDNSYEIYKKTTEYKDNGWIMSNVIQKINIIPIGKYGILKEMN